MITVVEGVETSVERERLRDIQCDRFQGYLFARPMAAADVIPWLESRP